MGGPAELIVQSVALGFSQEERPWTALLSENYSTFRDHGDGQPFSPFWIEAKTDPAFYICFSGKPKLSSRLYRLFLDVVPQHVEPLQPGRRFTELLDTAVAAGASERWMCRPREFIVKAEEPQFKWEYRAADRWMPLEVIKDGTEGFAHEGMLEFLSPAQWAQAEEFNQTGFWLRVRWEVAELVRPPRLRRVALNGVEVEQWDRRNASWGPATDRLISHFHCTG